MQLHAGHIVFFYCLHAGHTDFLIVYLAGHELFLNIVLRERKNVRNNMWGALNKKMCSPNNNISVLPSYIHIEAQWL